MDATMREGRMGAMRAVAVLLATLTLLLVAAVAVAEKADAHQTAGRVVIFIDGEKVKNTKDNHFTFERTLSPGCHTVKVVEKRGGQIVSQSIRRFCSDERTRLVVKVNDGSVSSTTYSTNSG